jgi:hypothetical protein
MNLIPKAKFARIRIYVPFFILLISAWIYAQYGFNGPLKRDAANHLYAGQQMAEGIPPYVSIFNHKTPLS